MSLKQKEHLINYHKNQICKDEPLQIKKKYTPTASSQIYKRKLSDYLRDIHINEIKSNNFIK
jgi:hypothetical protein